MADNGGRLSPDSTSSHPHPPPCPPPAHPPPAPPSRPPPSTQLPPRPLLTHPPPPAPPPHKPQPHTSPAEESDIKATLPTKEKDEQPFKGGLLLGKRPKGSITMKLKSQSEAKKSKMESSDRLLGKPKSKTVAAAFGSDSEEEEEMPADAKLKMRNMGKDTPTSAGPNSFNKSKIGFNDPRGSWRNEVDQ